MTLLIKFPTIVWLRALDQLKAAFWALDLPPGYETIDQDRIKSKPYN